jgi:hypothetical protein
MQRVVATLVELDNPRMHLILRHPSDLDERGDMIRDRPPLLLANAGPSDKETLKCAHRRRDAFRRPVGREAPSEPAGCSEDASLPVRPFEGILPRAGLEAPVPECHCRIEAEATNDKSLFHTGR